MASSNLSVGDRKLGSVLLDNGHISGEELQRTVDRLGEVGGRLADVLIDLGIMSERQIAEVIATYMNHPLVDLTQINPDPSAIELVSAEVALSSKAVPIGITVKDGEEVMRVAMVDPLSMPLVEAIEDECDMELDLFQGLRDEVMWKLAEIYPSLQLQVSKPSSAMNAEDLQNTLGQRLISKGLVTTQQVNSALDLQKKNGEVLGQILLAQQAISEQDLYKTLAEQFGTQLLEHPDGFQPTEDILGCMLRADALRFSSVPIDESSSSITVLTSDPRKYADLVALIDRPINMLLGLPKDVERLIDEFYPQKGRLGETLVSSNILTREQLREALQVQAKGNKVQPLGDVIVEMGFATEGEVKDALDKQNAGGGRLEDTLVQSGKLSPEMLARSLATQLGYEFLDPAQNPPDPEVVSLVPEDMARRYQVIPIRADGDDKLVVAMKDPRNVFALDDLKLKTRKEILPAVMSEQEIIKLIERYYSKSSVSDLQMEIDQRKASSTIEELDISAMDDSAVVKTVNSIIREAALQGVSDIHVEPTETALKVRYRIDGTLREQADLPKAATQSLLARIKIMGALDIAERRLPQDGRIRFKSGSIDIDLRLSTLPTVYGEKAVMRLLQKASNIPEVEQLGFSPYNIQRYLEVVDRPNGIFLVTGPTGSGKSFTSFSTLKRLARPEKNTTTIEDPVEYEIPGIVQSQVNNAAGMTFARALRAFLRQDPDIIFVGEIRDTETAGIAVEAALTGHLVLATLHTNDAPGAVTRLEEMGIEGFNIAAAVVGVLAQRLVRRVCSECAQPTNADPDVLRRLGISELDLRNATLMRGAGCQRCGGTGYKGRMGIHELMVVDETLRKAISAEVPVTELKEIAVNQSGMKTLRTDGIEKALQGFTTLEEVLAVTAN